MRTIKYRAFHKELKLMREVCTLRLDFDEVIIKHEKDGWTDKTTWFEGQFELMQFTGLHDRNGTPVFESDILLWDKQNYGKIKVICRWDYYVLNQYRMYNTFLEVIGNIHENPELLETK